MKQRNDDRRTQSREPWAFRIEREHAQDYREAHKQAECAVYGEKGEKRADDGRVSASVRPCAV